MKKLFAKEAVQLLLPALSGRLWACRAKCVSQGVVAVGMWMYVTDTVDVVLCCPFIYALPREIFL